MKDSLRILLPVALLLAAGVVYVSWTPDAAPEGAGFEHPPVAGFGSNSSAVGSRRAASSTQSPTAPLRTGARRDTDAGGPVLRPTGDNVSGTFYTEVALRREQLAENPADTLIMRKLARLLQDGHGAEEAADLYERYLTLAPDNHQVWLDLAATQASRRRWEDADAAMDRMLERFPGDESALYNKGAIAANAGRKGEAERLWRDLVSNGADQTIVRRARSSLEKLEDS